MGSQESTYFTFLSWKSSNDGGAMVSLGSLIALQCFTIYIMSNLSTLGVWTHDFLSYPEHSWRTDCFFTSFIRLWKILLYKNHKIIQYFRSEGTPWNCLIQLPAQSRDNFQGSTRLCPVEFWVFPGTKTWQCLQPPKSASHDPGLAQPFCNRMVFLVYDHLADLQQFSGLFL